VVHDRSRDGPSCTYGLGVAAFLVLIALTCSTVAGGHRLFAIAVLP